MRIFNSCFVGIGCTLLLLVFGCKSSLPVAEEYPPNEAVYYKQLYSLKQEGANIRSPYNLSLSEKEILLDSLLNQEREKMLAVYKERHYFPPARYFFGWKDHMDTTKLLRYSLLCLKGGCCICMVLPASLQTGL